jgi:hypothetical protein
VTIRTRAVVDLILNYDEASPTITYVGEAPTGTDTSKALWRIKRIDSNAPGTVLTMTWADGNSDFDNVWDNRASLSYS